MSNRVSLRRLHAAWRYRFRSPYFRVVGPLIFIVLVGAVYIANAWTPSSYGIVLEQLGVSGSGPVLGTARAIRSDEFLVLTPYIQIAVRNQFERYNQLSPYKEDLRAS